MSSRHRLLAVFYSRMIYPSDIKRIFEFPCSGRGTSFFIFICQSAVQLLFPLALKNVTKSINAFYDLPEDEGKEIHFFLPKINSNYSYESSE